MHDTATGFLAVPAPPLRRDNPAMRNFSVWAGSAGLAVLAACSPALDWRLARLDAPDAELLLPCKPDRGSRPVELVGQTMEMAMVGCETAGQVFAVSWVEVPQGVVPGEVLRHWQRATLTHLHALTDATQGAAAFAPAGTIPLPEAVRLATSGQRADGSPLQFDAAWLLRRQGEHTLALHAVVLAKQRNSAVVDNFFSNIRFK